MNLEKGYISAPLEILKEFAWKSEKNYKGFKKIETWNLELLAKIKVKKKIIIIKKREILENLRKNLRKSRRFREDLEIVQKFWEPLFEALRKNFWTGPKGIDKGEELLA